MSASNEERVDSSNPTAGESTVGSPTRDWTLVEPTSSSEQLSSSPVIVDVPQDGVRVNAPISESDTFSGEQDISLANMPGSWLSSSSGSSVPPEMTQAVLSLHDLDAKPFKHSDRR